MTMNLIRNGFQRIRVRSLTLGRVIHTMGRILGTSVLGAFFLGAPLAFAQSGFVSVAQLINTATSSQGFVIGPDFAAFFTTLVGSGFTGTISSAGTGYLGTFISGTNNATVSVTAYTTSSYSVSVGACNFDASSGIPNGTYTIGFIELSHIVSQSGTGCVMSPQYFYRIDQSWFWPQSQVDFSYTGASSRTQPAWVTTPGGQGVGSVYIPFFYLAAQGIQVTPDATSSGIFLSGAQTFCNAQFGSSTAGVFGIGSDIANAFCQVAGYLFIPTQQSLAQFTTLPSLLQLHIPFSYAYGLAAAYTSLQASSTENMQSFSIPFPALGSSTPLGAVVPTHIDFLSTTTISTYYPDAIRHTFLFLGSSAIWIFALMAVYRRIVPQKAL